MSDGKWVSKANLQTFWQMIRSNLASFVAEDVDDVLPTVVPEELNKVLPTMVGEQIDNKFGDDIGDNVTSWLTEHVNPAGSAVVVDDTLTIQGAAADAKKTGDEISGLKEDIIQNDNAKGYAIKTFNTVSGSAHSSSDDKVYLDVKSGQKYYVTLSTGDGQSVYTGFYANNSKVADVQANGTKREYTAASDLSYFSAYIPTPNTTTYTMLIETDKSTFGITGKYNELNDQVQEIRTFNYEFSADGYYFNAAQQKIVSDSGYKYTKIGVFLYRGSKIYGTTAYVPNDSTKKIAFVDDNDNVITSYANPNTGEYKFAYNLDIPENAVYVYIPLRIASENDWVAPSFRLNTLLKNLGAVGGIQNKVTEIGKKTVFSDVPALRNGSIGNSSNANAVTTKNIVPIKHSYDYAVIRFNGDESLADSYAFSCAMFKNTTDGQAVSDVFPDSTYPRRWINENNSTKVSTPYIVLPIGEFEGYTHLAAHVFRYMNGTAVPIRIATDQYSISISYFNELQSEPLEVQNKLKNARHIKGNAIAPLTLLHFSDIHADKAATGRIINDSKKFGTNIDGIICTGDIVNNTAGEIAQWWYPQVMTCIGNHDCASYSSETGYDWTALSMADRDAYYIAPFESNWGITHTSGTSYYYKDYSTQKIRLIVMDVMLYNDNGAEATAQTTWLEELLASAITNNLHVIIAIHAPHGGATAKDCSFSRYGQTAMPTNTDCNTPQVVIDAVATKITEGLKFIGYLVGHTHQDNIWDAEDDGKQLMYCITCGIVSENAQWRNSDQNRDNTEDAYNLVTIDTANTLVKIVRGGGANIDDHMRTRKAICFNYSTGEKVGEVL